MTMTTEEKISQLTEFLQCSNNIVFLTGAGMSTESGLPDFRSPDGLYASGVNENIFDIDHFNTSPENFYKFASKFVATIVNVKPHAGHTAITELAENKQKEIHVCTQNIDLLHQNAGNPNVHTLHGSIKYSSCTKCGYRAETACLMPEIKRGQVPRHEDDNGIFKPDIVFFGEMLSQTELNNSLSAVSNADLVIIAGTSLVVQPAAGIPRHRPGSSKLAIINQTETYLDNQSDLVIRNSIKNTLKNAVNNMSC